MSPIQLVRDEWEKNTQPRFRMARRRKVEWEEQFREYGWVEAWLEWDEAAGVVEIKKLESVRPGRGAGTALLEFLKELADRYQITIFGNAIYYDPHSSDMGGCELSPEQVENQKRLERWYRRLGFQVHRHGMGIAEIWYPRLP